jgi:hypothetical protein
MAKSMRERDSLVGSLFRGRPAPGRCFARLRGSAARCSLRSAGIAYRSGLAYVMICLEGTNGNSS